MNRLLKLTLLSILLVCGFSLHLHNNNFGLPHSFFADEPEIAEIAIKQTYELRTVLREDSFYKLIPVSFVYGTFPANFLTLCVMAFSKLHNLLNIPFEKPDVYIFLRSVTAFFTFTLIPLALLIYKNIFNRLKTLELFLLSFIILFNWKLIAHSHYVNADIILTTLNFLGIYLFLLYIDKKKSYLLAISGVVLGFAIGTKVTALIILPIVLFSLLRMKDLYAVAGYVLSLVLGFIISNPYSFALFSDFSYRVYLLNIKENGLVFDSVDKSLFKYVFALLFMLTPAMFLLSTGGMMYSLRKPVRNEKHLLLVSIAIVYVLFYSLSSRRVDRWLLPALPIFMLYATFALQGLLMVERKLLLRVLLLVLVVGSYVFYTPTVIAQFKDNTPKSSAYLWLQENVAIGAYKLVVTKEGLDPLNKLPNTTVFVMDVYESQNGYLKFPVYPPQHYHYVIVSPRLLHFYKNPAVAQRFPYYASYWATFEQELYNPSEFRLIKTFELSKPNLVGIDDVLIFEKVFSPVPFPD